ncbi:MAG TPA: PilZ domain-containing protein [Haliangiales bacterium]|nr:PilZ domain-containing protein [Haliangiales bacterium]
MAASKKEERASERFELRLAVNVALGERRFTTETANVSLGGAFLLTEEKPPLGTKLALQISLPSQKELVQVGATVRWVDTNGIGVQFDGLRARDVWALGKLLP